MAECETHGPGRYIKEGHLHRLKQRNFYAKATKKGQLSQGSLQGPWEEIQNLDVWRSGSQEQTGKTKQKGKCKSENRKW